MTQEERQAKIQKVIEDVKRFQNKIKERSKQYEQENIEIRAVDNYYNTVSRSEVE